MPYTVGEALLIIGLGIQIVGGLLFRKPGVSFWTASSVLKPGVYLKPAGAGMLVLGSLFVVTSIILSLLGARHQ